MNINISLLVSIIAASISSIMAIISWKSAYYIKKKEIEHNLRSEHDELVQKYSVIFWQCLREAYNQFRENRNDLPNDLHEFIDSSGYPPGLKKSTDPINYKPHNSTHRQDEMWDFIRRIFPIETYGNRSKLEENSIIPNNVWSSFFNSRSKLTGFWDRWTNRIKPFKICKIYPGQKNLVLILTWLDIAHRQWTGEQRKSKEKMYELARLPKKGSK